MADHLTDNSGDLPVRQLEHGRKSADGESIVVGSICEEVSSEAFLLDLFGKHGLDGVWLCHELPNFDRVDELGSLLPFTGRQSLGCLHNMVSSVLRWTGKDLAFMVLKHTAVGLADDSLLDVG